MGFADLNDFVFRRIFGTHPDILRHFLKPAEGDLTRIHECTSSDTLDRWIDNIFGARTITDVLS